MLLCDVPVSTGIDECDEAEGGDGLKNPNRQCLLIGLDENVTHELIASSRPLKKV